ncbi:hypothetical protein IWQ61_002482 [Dispira simplex]|nr:hypothetical protein IWQ61_002482 [Dispira simplex]
MDLFKSNRGKKKGKDPSSTSPTKFAISGPLNVTESTYYHHTTSIALAGSGDGERQSRHLPPGVSHRPPTGMSANTYAERAGSSIEPSPGTQRRNSKTNSTSTVSTQNSGGNHPVSPSYGQPPGGTLRQSVDQASLLSNNSSFTAYSDAQGYNDRLYGTRNSNMCMVNRSVPSYLTQPVDLASDNEIHAMFEEFIDSMGIPETKRNEMRTLAVENKRTMIQVQQQQQRNQHYDGTRTQDSPAAFIEKISGVDLRYVSLQTFRKLRVAISTHPIHWIREFIDEKGLVLLAECLGKLNHRPHRRDQDNNQEWEIMRALKAILNLSWGAHEVLAYPRCVSNICHSLDSPLPQVRKLAVELLTFLCYSDFPHGHELVLQGMESFQRFRSMQYRFEPWLVALERTIDGRGRMGSMVGASQEVRQLGMVENDLIQYALCNVLLMNALVEVCEDIDVRIHLRQELQKCGINRIRDKLLALNNEHIQQQLEKYARVADHDNNELMEFHHYQALQDMSDPHEVFEALLMSLEGRSSEAFVSILQHLLLIREDTETKNRYLQLIDQLVSQIVLDGRGVDSDFSTTFGVSVATLAAKFSDEEQLLETLKELSETKEQLEQVRHAKSQLELEVSMKADGLVQALKDKVLTLEDLLRASRHTISSLHNQIKELREQFQAKLASRDTQLKQIVKSFQNQVGEQGEFSSDHDLLMLENKALREGDVLDLVEEPTEPGTNAPVRRRWKVNQEKLNREIERLLKENVTQSWNRQTNLFSSSQIEGGQPDYANVMSTRNKMTAARAKLEMLFEDVNGNLSRKSSMFSPSLTGTVVGAGIQRIQLGDINVARGTAFSINGAEELSGPVQLTGIIPTDVTGSLAASTPQTLAAQLAGKVNGLPPSSTGTVRGPSVPPPPPPAPMASIPTARRKEIRFVPKTKLKQLQWEKLDDLHIDSTVWQQTISQNDRYTVERIEDALHDKGVLGQIETMFNAKAAAVDLSKRSIVARKAGDSGISRVNGVGGNTTGSPGMEGAVDGGEEPIVREKISVLDPKRAHNINLMLGRLKHYTFSDLRRAILRCDNTILKENVLTQLLKFLPTASERGLLSAYNDDVESLAGPDAFFVEMMKIDRYEQRLRMILFWTTFEEKFGYLREDVNNLLQACHALPNSESFPTILGIVLTMGNFMNGTGFRGGAFGFKIHSLNKLVDTKASDNKTTLLHFLADITCKEFPEALQFLQELKPIEEACRVSSTELKKDFGEMKAHLQELGTELEAFKRKAEQDRQEDGQTDTDKQVADDDVSNSESLLDLLGNSEDRFLLVMTSFHDIAKDRFTTIQQMYEDMQDQYQSVAQLYGEDPKRMPPEEFFGIFRTFSTSFEKSLKDNEAERERRVMMERHRQRLMEQDNKRREQQREKERRQQMLQQQMSAAAGNSGSTPANTNPGEGGAEKGVMDNLLQSLISGNGMDTYTRRTKRDIMTRRRSELRRSIRRTSVGNKALEMLQKIRENEGKGDENEGMGSGLANSGNGIITNPTLAASLAMYPPSPRNVLGNSSKAAVDSPLKQSVLASTLGPMSQGGSSAS